MTETGSPPMEQRVSLITLGVADIDASAAFYKALGWRPVDSADGVVAFDLIGQTLGLYPKAALADELGLDPNSIGGFSGITLAHNLRSRDAVDALFARAIAAGAKEIKPPQEVFWGGYHAYVADPDGHMWELAHNPFSELGPDGSFQWRGAGTD